MTTKETPRVQSRGKTFQFLNYREWVIWAAKGRDKKWSSCMRPQDGPGDRWYHRRDGFTEIRDAITAARMQIDAIMN